MDSKITLDLADFIVHYPIPDPDSNEDDYSRIMGAKREFRELASNPNRDFPDDSFFRNYQMLIGRWMAPWTNNRSILVRWDPGVGKTRAALSFALMWQKYSAHKNILLLSDSDIIHKALKDEVVNYNKYDEELNKKKYAQGPKGQGRSIKQTRFVNKQGFMLRTIKRFMHDELKDLFEVNNIRLDSRRNKEESHRKLILENKDALVARIRKKYATFVIVVDEAHTLRYTGDTKQNYEYLMIFLDAVRDICPILEMTATPVVNSWKDVFSIIGMLYPEPIRKEILASVEGLPDVINTEDSFLMEQVDNALDTLMRYAKDKVSYRNAEGVVPKKIYFPPSTSIVNPRPNGLYHLVRSENSQPADVNFIYPVFMSLYQTYAVAVKEYAARGQLDLQNEEEIDEFTKELNQQTSFYLDARLAYDFVKPLEISDITTLVNDENGKYSPSTNATITLENGESDQVFKLEYFNGQIDLEKGLGKYSIKIATVIDMLNRNPTFKNMAGYIHTLWVANGIKMIAAALVANGWEQYTGKETISAGQKPRFAIIQGGTKDTPINKIIQTFNSEKNRNGSILRVILGSKKSGISISLTNAQFFFEMSADFNKSTNIQSQGRVFRTDSLTWKIPREVITLNIVALPYGSNTLSDINQGVIRDQAYYLDQDGNIITADQVDNFPEEEVSKFTELNPFTIEIWMQYLSEIKAVAGERVMNILREASIEETIKKSIQEGIPIDDSTDALMYNGYKTQEYKKDIIYDIQQQWISHINIDNMYQMRGVAELISSNTMALTRYGMPRPVQTYGSVATGFSSSGCQGSICLLSQIYDSTFFLTTSRSSYMQDKILDAIRFIANAPDDKYGFAQYICRPTIADFKIIALELALAMHTSIPKDQVEIFNKKRLLILDLFSNFWNAYGNNRIVHCLWYGIKHNSQLMKEGINSIAMGQTRVIIYDKDTNQAVNEWHYIENAEDESVYLSSIASSITDKERNIIAKAMDIGYYIHLSVADGGIRLRKISFGDKRQSTLPSVRDFANASITSKILGIPEGEVSLKYQGKQQQLEQDVYLAAMEKGLLIIR